MSTALPRLLAAVAAVALATAGCTTTGMPSQTAATEVRQVTADGLTQTVAAEQGFDRVTVHTATYGETDGVDGTLVLEVTSGGETRETAAAGEDLIDNGTVTLVFDAVPADPDAQLTFRYEGQEPLALYVDQYDAYRPGTLTPGGGDLTFALGTGDRAAAATDAAGRVVTDTVDKATSDLPFLVVWLAALAGAGYLWHRTREPA